MTEIIRFWHIVSDITIVIVKVIDKPYVIFAQIHIFFSFIWNRILDNGKNKNAVTERIWNMAFLRKSHGHQWIEKSLLTLSWTFSNEKNLKNNNPIWFLLIFVELNTLVVLFAKVNLPILLVICRTISITDTLTF